MNKKTANVFQFLKLWWPVIAMMLCSVLSYLDRQILAQLAPAILSDLKLNAHQYTEIVSAFSWA